MEPRIWTQMEALQLYSQDTEECLTHRRCWVSGHSTQQPVSQKLSSITLYMDFALLLVQCSWLLKKETSLSVYQAGLNTDECLILEESGGNYIHFMVRQTRHQISASREQPKSAHQGNSAYICVQRYLEWRSLPSNWVPPRGSVFSFVKWGQ